MLRVIFDRMTAKLVNESDMAFALLRRSGGSSAQLAPLFLVIGEMARIHCESCGYAELDVISRTSKCNS